jgi:hypothetical protein
MHAFRRLRTMRAREVRGRTSCDAGYSALSNGR